jgi:hypothetical protein
VVYAYPAVRNRCSMETADGVKTQALAAGHLKHSNDCNMSFPAGTPGTSVSLLLPLKDVALGMVLLLRSNTLPCLPTNSRQPHQTRLHLATHEEVGAAPWQPLSARANALA